MRSMMLALGAMVMIGCAGAMHPLGHELDAAIAAARNPKDVPYIGSDPDLRFAFSALANGTPEAFRAIHMDSIARVVGGCQAESGPYVATTVTPTLRGVEVVVDASCFVEPRYTSAVQAGVYELTTQSVPDPDVGRSLAEMRERYPRLQYDVLVQRGRPNDGVAAPNRSPFTSRYMRVLGSMLAAEKFGTTVTVERTDQRISVEIAQCHDVEMVGNDIPEASARYARIVDDYGDGNRIATPWEYARFEEDALDLAAVYFGALTDPDAIRLLAETGARVAEAPAWIERVLALRETSESISVLGLDPGEGHAPF